MASRMPRYCSDERERVCVRAPLCHTDTQTHRHTHTHSLSLCHTHTLSLSLFVHAEHNTHVIEFLARAELEQPRGRLVHRLHG
jgi:hypothetical protein